MLNLFLAFLSPKFDPSLDADDSMEDGTAGTLPTKADQEFRPFVRRLPEFKFWYSTTKAIGIAFVCSWFSVFDVPVFWPVLVIYWLVLFAITSKSGSLFRFASLCSGYALLSRGRGICLQVTIVRRQIQHMIKYRYVPFTVGKAKYKGGSG